MHKETPQDQPSLHCVMARKTASNIAAEVRMIHVLRELQNLYS